MIKVAVIGCYYGRFPVWIQYWLKSCSDNKTIDFFVVTDLELDDIPENVHLINLKLAEVKELAERKIGMRISMDKPYKLCDYKPVYGLIFEDYLQEYDFWGHCDFDLIWGDIRRFIDIYELDKYDKFLPLGHLSLYRNTKEINSRYMLDGSKCGDYREVFSDERGHAFDEIDGIFSIYQKNRLSMFDKRIFAEIKTFHRRFRLKQVDRNYKHQVFYFKNGGVYRTYSIKGELRAEEYMYIHFRRKLQADHKKWHDIGDFYITDDGFIEMKSLPENIETIEKYNRNPGFIPEMFETLSFIFRNMNKTIIKIENEIIANRQRG